MIAACQSDRSAFSVPNAGGILTQELIKALSPELYPEEEWINTGRVTDLIEQRREKDPLLKRQIPLCKNFGERIRLWKGKQEEFNQKYFYPRDFGSSIFVGRDRELNQLHEMFQSSPHVGIVATSGMGGVGKTQLAWQYGDRYKQEYPGGIWWLSGTRLVDDVLSCSGRMELKSPPDSIKDTIKTDVELVQWYYEQWVKTIPQGKRLLIWDDVTDYGKVRSFFPQNDLYRVLITTRVKLGSSPVQRLELEVLTPEAALEMLCKLVDRDRIEAEKEAAQKLCEWLGRLPLGIELVGRYLAGNPTLELAKLLERLEKQRLQTKALQKVPEEMPYQDNLVAAFELSWKLLDEPAKELGCLLSVFALAPIKEDWILPGWDEEELEEALGKLLRFSLVYLNEKKYLLHTLIREFFAQKLETELKDKAEILQRNMAMTMVAETKTVYPTVTLADLARMENVIPHLQVVAKKLTALLDDDDVLGSFVALGRLAQGQNRWLDAEQWYENCLEISEQRFGPTHPDTATSLNNLALLYNSMGHYAEALALSQRALSIREQKLGPTHPDTNAVRENLAILEELIEQQKEI